MIKFKSICKENFRSGLLVFNRDCIYPCRYDFNEHGQFVFVYAFEKIETSYVYLSYPKQFKFYFNSLNEIRKDKLEKINESNL